MNALAWTGVWTRTVEIRVAVALVAKVAGMPSRVTPMPWRVADRPESVRGEHLQRSVSILVGHQPEGRTVRLDERPGRWSDA